jgi:hypothetical protein
MNHEFELDSLIKKMAEDHPAELPSPGLIWWRAQIVKRQEEKKRIERPVMIMRLVASAVCLAIFLAAIVASRNHLAALIGQDNWWLMPLGMLTMATVVAFAFALLPSRS